MLAAAMQRRGSLAAAAAAFRCLLLLVVAAAADDAGGAAQPVILATVCGNTTAADQEGFDVSFVNTLELIYQNVTRSGFGAASSGEGADTVYGLGQCMGYLSPTDCQLCYAQSRVKLPHCLPATGGRIYLDGCFLRYGADNFTAAATDASDTAVCSNATVSSPASFAATSAALLRNVTGRAGRQGLLLLQRVVVVVGAGVAVGVAAGVRGGAVLEVAERHRVRGVRGDARDRVVGRCLPRAAEGYGLNAGCVVRYSTQPFYLPANAAAAAGSSSKSI